MPAQSGIFAMQLRVLPNQLRNVVYDHSRTIRTLELQEYEETLLQIVKLLSIFEQLIHQV